MLKTKILFGEELVQLKNGMDKVHRAVSATLGSSGKNSVYREFNGPIVTNDGVSIANRIEHEDEAESIGADLIKQAARRTDEEAGDGTTTSIVLTHAMIEKGLEYIYPKTPWYRFFLKKKGANPMQLRREIEEATNKVIEEFEPKVIETDEEFFDVANISVEDEEIAKIVADSVKKAGLDGEVLVEESMQIKITKEEIDGYKFDRGYFSDYFVTDPSKMETVLHDVPVLITDKSISITQDIFPLIENLNAQKKNQLLLIAGDPAGEFLATAIANKMHGIFNIIIVKKPYSREVMEDIAIVTGGECLTEDKGIKKFDVSHVDKLGFAKKVIVSKESTLILNDNTEKVNDRIAALKEEMSKAEEYEKAQLKSRIARLAGSIVVIKVGASSEAEMKYKKLKIDDAVHAVKAARDMGVVQGGGKTLYNISLKPSDTQGEDIVRYACSRPIKQIIQNAGYDVEETLSKLQEGEIFNATTGACEINPRLIDPAKVEVCALKNAASLAGIFLTTDSAIVDIKKD